MKVMISNSERHFINQWLEQKSGPRWKYYLQFSIAWTIVSFLVIFFLTKLFTGAWENGGRSFIFFIIALSILSGFLSTHFTYILSEKKYKKIMAREGKSI
jgi:cation transporter-like permease